MILQQGQDTQNFVLQKRYGDSPEVRIGDVLPMLKKQWSDARIQAASPHLLPKKVIRARAYYNAKVRQQNKGAKQRQLRILCDENVSALHLQSCQVLFNHASCINFEGLTGRPDDDVWAHALEYGYDFIVTNDKRDMEESDLTRIAVNTWRTAILDPDFPLDGFARLPLLLHLEGKAKKGDRFHDVVASRVGALIQMRNDMDAPVLSIGKGGVQRRITAFDLIQCIPEQPVIRDVTRAESWARGYLAKVISREAFYDRETPHVRKVKRLITRAVAIAQKGRALEGLKAA